MDEQMDLDTKWEELINRGLNTKASNLTPLIDKFIREVCLEHLKTKYPKAKFHQFHFKKIKWEQTLNKYKVTIAPGLPVQKG